MDELTVNIVGIEPGAEIGGARAITIKTDRGTISTVLHATPPSRHVVVCVGGVGGGLDGPAMIYPRLGRELPSKGLAVFRLAYRKPGDTIECLADMMAGLGFLQSIGCTRVALVGHSFGGEIVIRAAAANPIVTAVVTIASRLQGAIDQVAEIAPRPLLLIHGDADEVLSDDCSRQLYARAGEPRTLRIIAGADHVLSQAPDEAFAIVRDWLVANFPANA